MQSLDGNTTNSPKPGQKPRLQIELTASGFSLNRERLLKMLSSTLSIYLRAEGLSSCLVDINLKDWSGRLSSSSIHGDVNRRTFRRRRSKIKNETLSTSLPPVQKSSFGS